MLQPEQLLNMNEVLQSIIVYFQAFDGQLPFKRIRIELSYFIVVYIQLFELL